MPKQNPLIIFSNFTVCNKIQPQLHHYVNPPYLNSNYFWPLHSTRVFVKIFKQYQLKCAKWLIPKRKFPIIFSSICSYTHRPDAWKFKNINATPLISTKRRQKKKFLLIEKLFLLKWNMCYERQRDKEKVKKKHHYMSHVSVIITHI